MAQGIAGIAIAHQADGHQPARQRGRRPNAVGQGGNTGWQRRRVRQRRQIGPESGRIVGLFNRQIIAKGGAQRAFVAGSDADDVEHHRPPACHRRGFNEQRVESLGLGAQAGALRARRLHGLARAVQGGASLRAGRFGPSAPVSGRARRRLGLGERGLGGLYLGLGDGPFAGLPKLFGGGITAPGQMRGAGLGLPDAAVQGGAVGLAFGQCPGLIGDGGVEHLHLRLGGRQPVPADPAGLGLAGGGVVQRCGLLGQPRQRRLGIRATSAFALQVAFRLSLAGAGAVLTGAQTRGLVGQPIAFHGQTLEGGGGLGGLRAQGVQGPGGCVVVATCLRQRGGQRGDPAFILAQGGARAVKRADGAQPAPTQNHRLGGADGLGKGPVVRCLPGLLAQIAGLTVQRRQHVV